MQVLVPQQARSNLGYHGRRNPQTWRTACMPLIQALVLQDQVLPGQAGLLGVPNELDCSSIGPDSDILDVEACEEQEAELAIR